MNIYVLVFLFIELSFWQGVIRHWSSLKPSTDYGLDATKESDRHVIIEWVR
jgi:hypothetical protein